MNHSKDSVGNSGGSTQDESAGTAQPMPDWMKALADAAPTREEKAAAIEAKGLEHWAKGQEAALKREQLRLGIQGDGADAGAPRQLVGRAMSQVSPRAIDWLWTGWIPRKYITLVVGESGAGKSTVLADIVARITTGTPWPGETEWRAPGRVLWLGSEDGAEDMTVPRLMACNANLERVIEIEGVRQGQSQTTFSMQDDIESVRQSLAFARDTQNDPFTALVIDPVTSYLPGRKLRKVDMNDTGQLRSILEPWFKIAQEFNIALICVTHFNKDATRSMLHRVTGSAVFAQTCRSLCAMVERPDDGEFQKAMVQVKTNLPEHPGGAWKFETSKLKVGEDPVNHKPINATRPVWHEKDESITPRSLMGGERGPVGSDHGAAFAIWLKAYFMSTNPEHGLPITQVKAAAIGEKVVSARWWDDHSGKYLDKRNVNGTWMCRPTAQPLRN